MTKYAKMILQYVRPGPFFIDYVGMEYSPATRHKIRGTDGNGATGYDFTPEEKEKISKALAKLGGHLIEVSVKHRNTRTKK